MTVYVDNMRARYGRMVMCHLFADTVEELHAMADAIGVALKWFQHPPGASYPHYDIALSKRALAIHGGAVECTEKRKMVQVLKACREQWLAEQRQET